LRLQQPVSLTLKEDGWEEGNGERLNGNHLDVLQGVAPTREQAGRSTVT